MENKTERSGCRVGFISGPEINQRLQHCLGLLSRLHCLLPAPAQCTEAESRCFSEGRGSTKGREKMPADKLGLFARYFYN